MGGSRLDHLALVVGADLIGSGGAQVTDVTHDSRQVTPGCLFVAVRGAASDGHRFVSAAGEAGAVALCVDHPVESPLPQLVTDDTRRAMAALAAEVHGHPSRSLEVVGVTGTNGKTTVTHYLESLAAGAGISAGLIGTVRTRGGGQVFHSARTTPESTDFQRLLAEMRDLGCRLVAVEVSSHALELGRVAGTRFEVAAFTNLSQDHLDFHPDMDAYLAAKKRLFFEHEIGTAVVNIDDPAGSEIARAVSGPLVAVGSGGDAFAGEVRPTDSGTAFRMTTPWGSASVEAPIRGRFNVDNAMLAAVSGMAAGMGFDDVVGGLAELPIVPGRFELVSGSDPVRVIVDYAHTPEGVRLAVDTARALPGVGRVIVLVGAGGDRDRDKRKMMGSASSAGDAVVITSDNPRSEDPAAIVGMVVAGVGNHPGLVVEVDRRSAIRKAIGLAEAGDIVLLLGRGHEPYQEVAGQMVPFDDRAVAMAELASMRSSTNSGSEIGSMES